MTRRLSSNDKVLFEGAEHASSTCFYKSGKSKQVAAYEWLSAEVRFANAVGIDFVIEPKEVPREEWQCHLFEAMAAILREARYQQFGNLVNAVA